MVVKPAEIAVFFSNLLLIFSLTLQGCGEMREHWGLCNPLHPLDVSRAVHVEAPEPEEDDTERDGGEDNPGTDSKDDSQDTHYRQSNLRGISSEF